MLHSREDGTPNSYQHQQCRRTRPLWKERWPQLLKIWDRILVKNLQSAKIIFKIANITKHCPWIGIFLHLIPIRAHNGEDHKPKNVGIHDKHVHSYDEGTLEGGYFQKNCNSKLKKKIQNFTHATHTRFDTCFILVHHDGWNLWFLFWYFDSSWIVSNNLHLDLLRHFKVFFWKTWQNLLSLYYSD